MSEIRTRHFTISPNHPTYFIADIAANHDGSLDRAIRLIELAAQAGANAAKFQNFKAETIVSRNGFLELGNKIAHQSDWKKDVVEVYRDASIPLDWTDKLRDACHANGIDYFTAPYDLDFINFFKNKMEITKIGSGDITWKESLELIAKSNTYVILATGASTIKDVENAMGVLESAKQPIVLMQCNTNYTGNENNIRFLNLNVLTYFKHKYPEAILGLSDHTHGHLSVIAAVTLGARVIEKHFTDDVGREGPDHRFSMTSQTWTEMVSQT
ncbi:MAG: hypothetical protein RLZZ44_73, partial [Bacteroidota bacterium]